MFTAEEIAQTIIETEPDISDFLDLVSSDKEHEAIRNIQETKDLATKLLKAEVFLIHYLSNNRLYYSAYNCQEGSPQCILKQNVSDCGITESTGKNWEGSTYTHVDTDHYINDKFKSNHILSYILEPKQYLTRYLWDKVRAKINRPIDLKHLNPDEFSFAMFKQHLDSREKLLTSADTMRYLEQIDKFEPEIRAKYIDLLFSNCQPMATKALKRLCGYDLPDKYMCISRYSIRWKITDMQLPIPFSVYDTRDSAYVPFIANVPRRVTSDLPNLSYLIGTLSVLKVLNATNPSKIYRVIIDSLTEHLSHPDYKEALVNYNITLQSQQSYPDIVSSLLGDN